MGVVVRASSRDIAENAIAVGDPDRVYLLAELLSSYRIVSRHRGFVVATGSYRGVGVTIASHGIGCPSASIVFEELIRLGARRIVRVGTAGALIGDAGIGDIVVSTGSIHRCGACCSSMYTPDICPPLSPDPILTALIIRGLRGAGARVYTGPVYTSDALYAETRDAIGLWRRMGAIAVEMESAALYTVSWIHGISSAAVFAVSNNLVREGHKMAGQSELAEAFKAIGRAVLEAFLELRQLGATAPGSSLKHLGLRGP